MEQEIGNLARRHVLVIASATLGFILLIGTIIFHRLEDWTWIESFYFTVVTITTVGYGDLSPSNDASRLAASLFILGSVGTAAAIVGFLSSNFMKTRLKKRRQRRRF